MMLQKAPMSECRCEAVIREWVCVGTVMDDGDLNMNSKSYGVPCAICVRFSIA
jgi:hypothetical protein